MKYELKGNINFVIDLNYEILCILQKIARPESEWISFYNEDYVNKIKSKLDMESKEVKDVLEIFKLFDFLFEEVSYYCNCIDEKYNILSNYKKIFIVDEDDPNAYAKKATLKYMSQDFDKIEKLEGVCKNLFNSIDYKCIYELLKQDCTTYINEIKSVLDKKEYKDRMISFYGKQLGEFEIICSFVSGNFGMYHDNKQKFVRRFVILEDNHIKLNLAGTIRFYFHEFSHPYIWEMLYKYKDKFIEFPKYFESLTLTQELSPYKNDPINFLNETLTRANEAYFTAFYLPEKAQNYIETQMEFGISYFKDLVYLITNNIDSYNNYEELFVDKIISFINSLVENRKL